MAERTTLKISRVRDEGGRSKTLFFPLAAEVLPGQFYMITDYEGGEKPVSVSVSGPEGLALTIKEAGPFTNRLCGKKPGDLLSLRGPFGSFFRIVPGKVLLVGGGCGIAPLHFLSLHLLSAGTEVTVINGAKKAEELLLGERFRALPVDYREAVEDVPGGMTAVEAARRLLEQKRFDFVYASGPEMMLVNLKPLLTGLPYQFSMERYMKCGVGICGGCACDPTGLRICVEGPVLDGETVEGLKDFGVYKRDASGARVYFNSAAGRKT
jgi:dihydroorotate dehydrogenase electron transfer subunit